MEMFPDYQPRKWFDMKIDGFRYQFSLGNEKDVMRMTEEIKLKEYDECISMGELFLTNSEQNLWNSNFYKDDESGLYTISLVANDAVIAGMNREVSEKINQEALKQMNSAYQIQSQFESFEYILYINEQHQVTQTKEIITQSVSENNEKFLKNSMITTVTDTVFKYGELEFDFQAEKSFLDGIIDQRDQETLEKNQK